MPFIDARICSSLDEKKKEELKNAFGQAIALLDKPEKFLMVQITPLDTLYLGGEKLASGAYIAVSLFGKKAPEQYQALTAELCRICGALLGIPADKVYISYHEIEYWGWNGKNF